MKLNDLKRGMRCTRKDGIIIYVECVKEDEIWFMPISNLINKMCDGMKDDLTNDVDDLVIVKVEDITLNGYETIWEREEPVK